MSNLKAKDADEFDLILQSAPSSTIIEYHKGLLARDRQRTEKLANGETELTPEARQINKLANVVMRAYEKGLGYPVQHRISVTACSYVFLRNGVTT